MRRIKLYTQPTGREFVADMRIGSPLYTEPSDPSYERVYLQLHDGFDGPTVYMTEDTARRLAVLLLELTDALTYDKREAEHGRASMAVSHYQGHGFVNAWNPYHNYASNRSPNASASAAEPKE